jgi:hypothetical protein
MVYETKLEDGDILKEEISHPPRTVFGKKYDFDLDGELRYVKPNTSKIDDKRRPPIKDKEFCERLIAFVTHLHDKSPDISVQIYTGYKDGNGNIFRCDPWYSADGYEGPWQDWCYSSYAKNESNQEVPVNMKLIIEVDGLQSPVYDSTGRNILIPCDGLYVICDIIDDLLPTHHGAKTRIIHKGRFRKTLRKDGRRNPQKLTVIPLDSVTSPCIAVPDIQFIYHVGNHRFKIIPDQFIFVEPRDQWARIFIESAIQEYEENPPDNTV